MAIYTRQIEIDRTAEDPRQGILYGSSILDFDNIHFEDKDLTCIWYGYELIWEYLSSNLITSDNMILQSKDGFILESNDDD